MIVVQPIFYIRTLLLTLQSESFPLVIFLFLISTSIYDQTNPASLRNVIPTHIRVDSDNDSNSKLSILTPIAGTYVKLICDGVNWYVNGSVISATDTAIVFADQS